MAEALLNVSKPQHQKKRKSNESAHPKNKKSMELISAIIPSSSAGAISQDLEVQTDKGQSEVIKKPIIYEGRDTWCFIVDMGK